MAFDPKRWSRQMDVILGTKVQDPLVRWSERKMGPFRSCPTCKLGFTPLGLARHVCKEAKPR